MRKEGYISVFLALILIPMVLGLTFMINIAKYYQYDAALYGEIELAANALLSKFDRDLFSQYGVLGVQKECFDESNMKELAPNIYEKPFVVDECSLIFTNNLRNLNVLEETIIQHQTNRFIYNTGKMLVDAIAKQIGREEESEIFSNFNLIAASYEKILQCYTDLNNDLLEFRNNCNDGYYILVDIVSQKEVDIINSINSIRHMMKTKDSNQDITNNLEAIRRESKAIYARINTERDNYESLIEILNKILVSLNSLEREIHEINELSGQMKNLESDKNAQQLKSLLSEANKLNEIIDCSKLKQKAGINLDKAESILEELESIKIGYREGTTINYSSYSEMQNIDMKTIENFNTNLAVVSYEPIYNTELYKLDIYQEDIEKVISSDNKFKNFLNNLQSLFSADYKADKNITIDDKLYSKLYSQNYIVKENEIGLLNHFTEKLITVSYIIEKFDSIAHSNVSGKKFFENCEMEYILNGKLSAEKNIVSSRRKIIALRAAANLEYILASPEMMNFINEIALSFASLNPVLSPVMKILVTSAIAVAEGNLDYSNLINNKKVSLLKTKNSWNLSVVSLYEILEGKCNVNHIKNEDGLSYDQYLALLIFMQKKMSTLERVGDVIELNMNDNMNLEDEFLDLSKFYQGVVVTVQGNYVFNNHIDFLKINIIKEGEFEY